VQRQSKKRQGKVLVDDEEEEPTAKQSADATAQGTAGGIDDDAVSLMSVGRPKPTGIAAFVAPLSMQQMIASSTAPKIVPEPKKLPVAKRQDSTPKETVRKLSPSKPTPLPAKTSPPRDSSPRKRSASSSSSSSSGSASSSSSSGSGSDGSSSSFSSSSSESEAERRERKKQRIQELLKLRDELRKAINPQAKVQLLKDSAKK
jgi:uncharacterized membrane protein YgcG